MGNKIQRIYVGTNQVRPTEITETFRLAGSSGTSLYKAGYKIKEVTIQWTVYNNTGGWSVTPNWGINKTSNSLDVRSIFRCASQRHYSGYADSGNGFIGGWRNNAGTGTSDTVIQAYASSSTTSTGGSCLVTFDVNGGHLKSGTTFGSWTQDVTYTHNSTIQTRIKSIFEGNDVAIVGGNSTGTTTNDLMTITREPAN